MPRSFYSKETPTGHVLKTHPPYWEALICGGKTFELRKNDRAFSKGDSLILAEFDPETSTYTGRSATAVIRYVLENFPGLEPGFAILGLSEVQRHDP